MNWVDWLHTSADKRMWSGRRAVVMRSGRRAELLGVKLGFPRSRCHAVVSDVLCVRSHLHVVCMCVICVCVYVCGHDICIHLHVCMYLCIYAFIHVYIYIYICVCVSIFVHRLWVLVSVLQRVDGVMHAHVFSCAYACVYICM